MTTLTIVWTYDPMFEAWLLHGDSATVACFEDAKGWRVELTTGSPANPHHEEFEQVFATLELAKEFAVEILGTVY